MEENKRTLSVPRVSDSLAWKRHEFRREVARILLSGLMESSVGITEKIKHLDKTGCKQLSDFCIQLDKALSEEP